MSVSTLLEPEHYIIPVDDKTLLSECIVTTFRASGKGGQHINKTDSAVRIRHIGTGIVVTCQSDRSQYLNKKKCIARIRQKLELISEKKNLRIPTNIPVYEQFKRKTEKIIQGKKKKLRQKPQCEE